MCVGEVRNILGEVRITLLQSRKINILLLKYIIFICLAIVNRKKRLLSPITLLKLNVSFRLIGTKCQEITKFNRLYLLPYAFSYRLLLPTP